jgi:hypothetical protein
MNILKQINVAHSNKFLFISFEFTFSEMNFYFRYIKLTNKILLIITLSLLTACKKSNVNHDGAKDIGNTMPVSMTHIETYATSYLNFSYNKDSTLNAINSSGYEFEPSITVTYKPNTILIQRKPSANSSIFSLDSVSLNAAGRIINVRQFLNPERTSWGNDQYTLNANNEIIQIERGVSSSQKTAEFPFTYVNGNLIHDATAATYIYDLTKPAQFGDRNSITSFLTYGVKYNSSKNLVVSAVYGTDTTFYKYTYDEAGRITEYHQEQQGKMFTQYKISYK